MCVYIFIHICTYTFIRISIYVYIYIFMHTFTYICRHPVHIYTYMSVLWVVTLLSVVSRWVPWLSSICVATHSCVCHQSFNIWHVFVGTWLLDMWSHCFQTYRHECRDEHGRNRDSLPCSSRLIHVCAINHLIYAMGWLRWVGSLKL